MLRTWGMGVVAVGCVVLGNACDDVSPSQPSTEGADAGATDESRDDTSAASQTHATTFETASVTTSTGSNSMTTEPDAARDDSSRDFDPSSDGDASEPASTATDAGDNEASFADGGIPSEAGPSAFALPPANGGLDYQLGGGYELPQGVTIVSRDRTDTPAPGAYNICYINGFQVQPGEEGDWDADLLLRDDGGEVVIDEDWDEALLDVSSADKRERIANVVGDWIAQCARDGFEAVEIDNLDTFTRSDARISEDDAVDFIARLSAFAHAAGLAIAQKNSVELVSRRNEMGTDFVVSEECNAWEECDGYIEAYGTAVLMIEYGHADFERGCELYGDEFSIVYRDRDLTRPTSDAYLYEGC